MSDLFSPLAGEIVAIIEWNHSRPTLRKLPQTSDLCFYFKMIFVLLVLSLGSLCEASKPADPYVLSQNNLNFNRLQELLPRDMAEYVIQERNCFWARDVGGFSCDTGPTKECLNAQTKAASTCKVSDTQWTRIQTKYKDNGAIMGTLKAVMKDYEPCAGSYECEFLWKDPERKSKALTDFVELETKTLSKYKQESVKAYKLAVEAKDSVRADSEERNIRWIVDSHKAADTRTLANLDRLSLETRKEFLEAKQQISSTGLDKPMTVIFEADLKKKDWLKPFGPPPWTEGLERTKQINDPEMWIALEVTYPKGVYGNEKTGAQWPSYFGKSYDRLLLSYWVKFGPEFDFVLGGKLPGLMGGHRKGHPHSNLTGGHKPDGTDGWSARIMWRKNGEIVQYVYHKDQPGKWGEDFPWRKDGKPVKFIPWKWAHVSTEVTMNTLGRRDGRIRSWLDDNLVLDQSGFEFRTVKNLGIDALYFSTFFGGDSPEWSPKKDETIRFNSFNVVAY